MRHILFPTDALLYAYVFLFDMIQHVVYNTIVFWKTPLMPQRLLQYYLIFVASSFVILTFLFFNLELRPYKRYIIILRDILRRSVVVCVMIQSRSRFTTSLSQWHTTPKILLTMMIILIIVSAYSTITTTTHVDISLTSMIVWFKYDIYPLWLLRSWLIVWYGLALRLRHTQRKTFFFRLFWVMIIGGVIFQISKIVIPDRWTWFGFGELGDFAPWHRPPLYYRTWPWGLMRLSWFLPWPNVLWFLLVLCGWRLVYQTKQRYGRTRAWASVVVLITITLATFSRGALGGLWIAAVAFILLTRPRKRRVILASTVVLVSGAYILNLTKSWSNSDRWSWLTHALESIHQHRIRWHGLWMSWPSLHYKQWFTNTQDYPLALLENIYLQWLYDLGIVWSIMIIFFLSLWAYWTRQLRQRTHHHGFLLLSCGLLGLLAEWLFLHVFIDSIVNILFFSCYGIIAWHALDTTDKTSVS